MSEQKAARFKLIRKEWFYELGKIKGDFRIPVKDFQFQKLQHRLFTTVIPHLLRFWPSDGLQRSLNPTMTDYIIDLYGVPALLMHKHVP